MQDLNESAINSLDISDEQLLPFIDYLLQDLWEIGSSSQKMIDILEKNKVAAKFEKLKILDLGCGKGGISIPIAKKYNAEVTGIDAMQEFINTANKKAKEWGVEKKCSFIAGDAEEEIKKLNGFNIVMFASVGPILGNIYESLKLVEKCIVEDGFVLIDDCYLPDKAVSDYTRCLRETEFFNQVKKSNFVITDKLIHSVDETTQADDYIYKEIEKRVNELSVLHPDKKKLFEDYLYTQRKENYALENELKCVLLLLQKHKKGNLL